MPPPPWPTWFVALPALLLPTLSCGGPGSGRDARPDVVLVSIDSLRPDRLGSYGHARPTSPTLDALAAEGVRFADAVSTTSWTLPAHAALFTSLYDSAHGVDFDGLRLSEEQLTLAEVLADAGYRTAGFFGGPYLDASYGLAQGFETWQSCMTEATEEAAGEGHFAASHTEVTGPRTVTEVERWLEDLDERPFFLFLHLWDVHYDYIAPQAYVELFDPDYRGALRAERFMSNPQIHAGMPERDLEHLLALYDAEIRFTDDNLRRILASIDARGRLADAIVVVTSDHGEEFFEHGRKGHRRTLFDEVVRIPLIVRWPGRLPAGRVVEEQVRLIDVMPTLLALADLPLPRPVQGRDLGPLLRGETLPPADALLEMRGRQQTLRALRGDGRKLIRTGPGRFRSHDLVRDPGEKIPLRGPSPRIREEKARLADLVTASRELRESLGAGVAEAAPSPEVVERLRALGYLEEDGASAEASASETDAAP